MNVTGIIAWKRNSTYPREKKQKVVGTKSRALGSSPFAFTLISALLSIYIAVIPQCRDVYSRDVNLRDTEIPRNMISFGEIK